jgi:hypothetical protein
VDEERIFTPGTRRVNQGRTFVTPFSKPAETTILLNLRAQNRALSTKSEALHSSSL